MRYFTHFGGYALNAQPADWARGDTAQVTWQVVVDALAVGGRVLRCAPVVPWNGQNSSVIVSLIWTLIGQASDFEIGCFYRQNGDAGSFNRTNHPLRVSKNITTDRHSYQGEHRSDGFDILVRESAGSSSGGAGTTTILGATAGGGVAANTWYGMRLKRVGANLTLTRWLRTAAADSGESAAVVVAATDGAPLAAGYVGVGATASTFLNGEAGHGGTDLTDFDVVGVTTSPATESAPLVAIPPNTPVVTVTGVLDTVADITGDAFVAGLGNVIHANSQFRAVRVVGGAVDYDSGAVAATVGPKHATGLTPGVTYTGQVRYQDDLGSWSAWGVSAQFITQAAPVVVGNPTTGITTNSATLHSTVTPNGAATDAWFEYSEDPTFATFVATAHQAIGAGGAPVAVVQALAGLTIRTDYYVRAAASNAIATVRSAGVLFSTLLPAQFLSSTYRAKAYRIRFATVGAPDVEGHVDFIIPGDYLRDEVVITGPTLRVQEGRTETQPIDLKIIESDPAITAHLGDINGRLDALGRLVDIQETTDGGTTWNTIGTGRLSSLTQPDGPGLWALQIDDERWIEREADIFVTADTTRVWPGGIQSVWRFIPNPPQKRAWFQISSKRVVVQYDAFGEPKGLVDPTGTAIIPAGGFAYHLVNLRSFTGRIKGLHDINFWYRSPLVSSAISYIASDEVPQANPGRLDGKGNFEHIRLRLGIDDYEIVTFGSTGVERTTEALQPDDGNGDPFPIDVWIVVPDGSPLALNHASLPAGSPSTPVNIPIFLLPGDWAYGYIYNAIPAPVSDSNPLHVGISPYVEIPYAPVTWQYGGDSGFIHPFALVKLIWDAANVRYDVAALNAFINDTQYSPVAFRITAKSTAARWLEDNIFSVYGVLPVPQVDGRLSLIKVRLPETVDIDTLPVLNASNCSTYPTWNNTSGDVVNSLTFSWQEIERAAKKFILSGGLPAAGLATGRTDDTLLDAPPDLVVVKDRTQVETDDNIGNLGYHSVEIPLLGTPADGESTLYLVSRGGGDLLKVGSPVQPTIRKVKNDIFTRFGDGPLRGTVEGLPSTEEIRYGDLVVLDFPDLPNPHLNDLGGQRIVQIVHKEQGADGPTFEFLDVGPALQPLDEPTFTLQLDPDIPGRVIVVVTSVPVGSTGLLELGFGTAVDHPTSWLMKYAGVTAGQVIVRDGLPADAWVWGRARAIQKNRISSLWAYESIQVTSTPAVLEASIVFEGTAPAVLWDLTPSVTHVRVYYAVYPLTAAAPSDLTDYLDFDATDDFAILSPPVDVEDGQAIIVNLEPWDGVPDDPGSVRGPRFAILPAFRFVGDVPAPEIQIKQINTTATSTDVQVFFTVTGGRSAEGYYTLGTTFPGAPNLLSGDIITIPRDTNLLEDRLLRVMVVPSSGPTAYAQYLVDWNLIPGFSYTNTPVPIFDADQVLVGWRLVGAVDDDARGLRWTIPAGLTVFAASTGAMAAGYWWMDTSTTKSYWLEVLEDPGVSAEIVAEPTELYSSGTPGILGAPYRQILRRPPQTKIEVRELTHSTRSLVFTVRPAGSTLQYRVNGGPFVITALGPTESVVAVSPLALSAGTSLIEWQSYIGDNIEELQALTIDVNQQPGIELQVFEEPAGFLHAVVTKDDEIVHWKLWATKNMSVLLDGVPTYGYRGDFSRQRSTYDTKAGAGPWEVVVEGYDYANQHVRVVKSIYIKGVATELATLSNFTVAVEPDGAAFKQRVRWDHNDNVNAVDHFVSIYENGYKLTFDSSPLPPTWEYTGVDTIPNKGSWEKVVHPADAGTPGAVFRTYTYRVELRRLSDGAVIMSGSTTISRYYAGLAPGGGPITTGAPSGTPAAPEVTNIAGYPPATEPPGLPEFGTGSMRTSWMSTSDVWGVRVEFASSATLGGAKTSVDTQDLDPGTSLADVTGYTSGLYAWARIQYFNDVGDGPWSDWGGGVLVF